ncbi:MAG: stage II sporulation protein R [Bacilli bacterium]|jgi:stage II sporulation protein R
MKKIVISILVVLMLITFKEVSLGEKIIPNEAIRFRVLANSNSSSDQQVKEKVKEGLQSNMYALLEDTKSVDEARTIIKTNMTNLSHTIDATLQDEDQDITYTIDFGSHYFPSKVYKGIEYQAGNYESLLVKIGKGLGDNWWCVLFPPLCLLEAEEATDVEYKFFVQELIDKFF